MDSKSVIDDVVKNVFEKKNKEAIKVIGWFKKNKERLYSCTFNRYKDAYINYNHTNNLTEIEFDCLKIIFEEKKIK